MTKLIAGFFAITVAILAGASYWLLRTKDNKKKDVLTARSYYRQGIEKLQAFGSYLKTLFAAKQDESQSAAA